MLWLYTLWGFKLSSYIDIRCGFVTFGTIGFMEKKKSLLPWSVIHDFLFEGLVVLLTQHEVKQSAVSCNETMQGAYTMQQGSVSCLKLWDYKSWGNKSRCQGFGVISYGANKNSYRISHNCKGWRKVLRHNRSNLYIRDYQVQGQTVDIIATHDKVSHQLLTWTKNSDG